MIAITEDTASSNAELSPAPAHIAPRPGSRIRVWLTDDNRNFRVALAELLTRGGDFDCERQFHSAEALLEALASEPAPDVILLDVEMGGMTGVDALRPVRELAPEVRVLIVTSFFDPMYEACAVRNSASAFLLKANAPLSLPRDIHRALSSPVPPLAAVPIDRPTSANSPERRQPGEKSLMARMGSWATQVSNLLAQSIYHRPAPTPK
jgi:DNA-binding NarL/FixJ family response regulator